MVIASRLVWHEKIIFIKLRYQMTYHVCLSVHKMIRLLLYSLTVLIAVIKMNANITYEVTVIACIF